MYLLDCLPKGHWFCRECLWNYVRLKFLDDGLVEIRCPAQSCNHILSLEEIKHISIDKDLQVKFEERLLQHSILCIENVVQCPGINCVAVFIRNSMQDRERVYCDHCQISFCSLCRCTYHYRSTCQEVSYWKSMQDQRRTHSNGRRETVLQREQEEMDSRRTIAEDTTPCPKCTSPIIKMDGCNHMTCALCKFEFCWLCLAPFYHTSSHGLKHRGPCMPHRRDSTAEALRRQWNEETRKSEFPISSAIGNPPLALEEVACDACNAGPLLDVYYSCLNCPSFNLCSSCEQSGHYHPPEHVLKEISWTS